MPQSMSASRGKSHSDNISNPAQATLSDYESFSVDFAKVAKYRRHCRRTRIYMYCKNPKRLFMSVHFWSGLMH